jgi:type II secretory ATPase GspE/PulE/Tfp pilus assembly ATPase PilB-like protein
MVSDHLRHMIVTRASVSDVRKKSIDEGMLTLKQDGIVKVFRGYTDIVQVRRTCAV